MSKIRLKRESAYADSLRYYEVELDGIIIGKIADGETREFNLDPGEHKLRLRIDFARSRQIVFETAKGEMAHFTCASNLRGSRAWLGVIYLLFLSHRYIKLEKVSHEK
jgi:hypothetical protein